MHMVFHIGHQIGSPLAQMIAGTAVMHLTERALNRVRAGTVGRQQEQGHARVGSQPWLTSPGFMDRKVIHDDREPPILLGGILLIEEPEQFTEQGVRFARPAAVVQRAGGQVERTSQVVLLVLARRHEGQLGASWHPSTAHLGQHVNIQLIHQHQGLTPLQLLVDKGDVCQTVDPLRGVILGHQLRPLPDPADFVEPVAHRLGGNRHAPGGLQRQDQCGTTPACAAPAIGQERHFEQSQQRPAEGGEPHLSVALQTKRPRSIRTHRAILAGARVEQDRRDVRRVASSGTQQQNMEGQQIALAPRVSALVPPEKSQQKCCLAWRGLLDTRIYGHIQCMIGAPRCANLVWTDLV